METLNTMVLALSGLAMLYASTMRLINPMKANFLRTYLAQAGNQLEKDIDLINETRGVGAVMLLGGILIWLGILLPEFQLSSFVVAIVLFLGVVLGRFISHAIDGNPHQDIVRATLVEAILCVLNLICFVNLFLH